MHIPSVKRPWLMLAAPVLAASASTFAAPPPVGEYSTPGGWGSLRIKRFNQEMLFFSITNLGANGHVCALEGGITGNQSRIPLEGEGEQPDCVIDFIRKDKAVEVRPVSGGCGSFCGAGASFHGTYVLLPDACKEGVRRQRRDRFLAQYRSRQYASAHATLDALYRRCGEFLNRIEIDQVRNDLAITLYHLGRSEECLSALKPTVAAQAQDEDGLRAALGPVDFANYIRVAQATWTNLRLCGRAP